MSTFVCRDQDVASEGVGLLEIFLLGVWKDPSIVSPPVVGDDFILGGAMRSLCFYNKQVRTPRDTTGLCPCELILSLQHVNKEPWRVAAARNGIQLRIAVQPVRRGQYDD